MSFCEFLLRFALFIAIPFKKQAFFSFVEFDKLALFFQKCHEVTMTQTNHQSSMPDLLVS